jgi:hypothetical protein
MKVPSAHKAVLKKFIKSTPQNMAATLLKKSQDRADKIVANIHFLWKRKTTAAHGTLSVSACVQLCAHRDD